MFKPLPQVLQVQRLATRLGRTRRPLRPTLESRISTTSPLSNALISAPLHTSARRQMPIKTDMASQETPNGVVKDAVKDVQIKGAGGKVLPEPYKSCGDEAKDTLAFLHMLEQLKLEKRSGWIREGVKQAESISDHMCRMALMAMMIPSTAERPLDISRCVQMCLVHDLAEAYVGDITPVEGVPASVKHELEEKAMSAFLDEMLGGPSNAQARERFRSLWEEYEARETPESKLVKDLDRLELVLQGVEYERADPSIRSLGTFYTGSIPHLEHPSVRGWAESVMAERKQLWEERGRGEEEQAQLNGVKVGEIADAKARAKAESESK